MTRKKQKKISKLDKQKEKIEKLLVSAKEDREFLLKTQKKLAEDVQKISFQLFKNEGALAILEKILEDK